MVAGATPAVEAGGLAPLVGGLSRTSYERLISARFPGYSGGGGRS